MRLSEGKGANQVHSLEDGRVLRRLFAQDFKLQLTFSVPHCRTMQRPYPLVVWHPFSRVSIDFINEKHDKKFYGWRRIG